MAEVKVTVEVLGKKLTKDEATALYYELQRELGIAPRTISIPYPAPVPTYPWWPTTTYGSSAITRMEDPVYAKVLDRLAAYDG